MADHFLSKTRVSAEDFVMAGDRPVLERYADLQSLLTDRAGPEVAALFAEPLISKGNDAAPPTVSWYAGSEGDPRALARLDPAERDAAERFLADHLRPLRALTENPATRELALGALTVIGQDDVVVVSGRPVIVNWGLMPAGNGANAMARPAHYAATLGKYLALTGASAAPVAAAPAAALSVAAPVAAAVASSAVPPAAASATGQQTADPVPPQPPTRRGLPLIAWLPLLILLLIACAVLAWLLQPGTRLFHADDTPPAITDEATLNAARALNDSLRERQATLETAIEGAVCRSDGILLLPDGRSPEGLLPPVLGQPPEEKAGAAPDALLPSTPNRVLVPTEGGKDTATLLDIIEARTVLVLVGGPGGMTVGSGFALGPGLIVTNHHVIAEAMGRDGQVYVTGGTLKAPLPAQVLKSQGPLFDTGGDFALLQIEAPDIPVFAVYLPEKTLKLTNVIAAGYPGDVLEMDVSFAALKQGDATAVPDLTVTDGTVNTEQQIGPDTHVLMHSAPLSSGNSGGPLVDMCGRVVGVNTFVKQGKMQNRGFALATADLMAFLQGTVAQPVVVTEACAPVVMRPTVVAAPKADPDTQPDTPADPPAKPASPEKPESD